MIKCLCKIFLHWQYSASKLNSNFFLLITKITFRAILYLKYGVCCTKKEKFHVGTTMGWQDSRILSARGHRTWWQAIIN